MDEDIWDYIRERNLEISDVYYKGAKRTGCVGCGFGCQFKCEPHRFELLYQLYPKYYDMIMKYQNNGVTYREAVRKVMATNNIELPDESGKILKTALHHAIIKDKNIVDMQDVEYAMKQSKIVKSEVKGMYE